MTSRQFVSTLLTQNPRVDKRNISAERKGGDAFAGIVPHKVQSGVKETNRLQPHIKRRICMHRKKGLLLGIATGLLITVSFATAKADDQGEGQTRPSKSKFGGTFLTSRIDTNGDGIAASWSTGELTGTLGKRSFQSINEVVPTGATAECPGGEFIIDAANGIGFGVTTQTFPNGDQIYSRTLTRHQCGLGGGKNEANDTTEIIGGTGKFEGVSGSVETHSISITQIGDGNAIPRQGFGFFTGESEGTITLP